MCIYLYYVIALFHMVIYFDDTVISGYILRWMLLNNQSIYLSIYLTRDFKKTAIVPIIKNNTGDSSDQNN